MLSVSVHHVVVSLGAALVALGAWGCGGAQAEAQGPRKAPAWAEGLTIGDPTKGSGEDESGYGSGSSFVPSGDEDDDEPIDFPTCDDARDTYVESYEPSGNGDPPDLKADQFGAILNRGTYLDACGVASSSEVYVCAAVIDGQTVGVTIELDPFDQRTVNCLVEALRSMSFPAHPKLDVAHTRFRPR